MKRLDGARWAMPGVLVIVWVFFIALPPIIGGDPMAADPAMLRQPPSPAHPFGTDGFGRDVWVRFLHGGGETVAATAGAASGAVLIALTLAAFVPVRGPFRWLFDRLLSALLAIPGLMFALSAAALFPRTPGALVGAVACAQGVWALSVLSARAAQFEHTSYLEAARSLGAPPLWIARVYRWPYLARIAIGLFPVVFASSLLMIAALQYLGVGGTPGSPAWGVMLYEGRQVYRDAPWVAAAPGVAITVLVALARAAAGRAGRAQPPA